MPASTKILDDDPWAGNPLKTNELAPSPHLTALLAEGGDPIARLPEKSPVAPPPGSWTREFVERALALTDAARTTKGASNIEDPLIVAINYSNIGNIERVRAIKDEIAKTNVKPFRFEFLDSDMSKRCTEPVKFGLDSCASTVQSKLHYASLELLSADREAAERYYAEADSFTVVIRSRLKVEDFTNIQQSEWFYSRTAYLLLAGRLEEGVASLKEWRLWAQKQGHQTGLYKSVFDTFLQAVNYSGKSLEQARFARMVGSDRHFDDIVVLDGLFLALDNALMRNEPVDMLIARLKLISEFPPKYTSAGPVFRNGVTLNLECRAAEIEVSRGRREVARELFDRVAGYFVPAPDDIGRELGLCLYRLAPRVGKADRQPELMQTMARLRARSIRVVDAIIDADIHGWYDGANHGGSLNLAREHETIQRLSQPISEILGASPKAPLLLNPQAFDDAVVRALEITKVPDLSSARGSNLRQLIDLALDRYQLVGDE